MVSFCSSAVIGCTLWDSYYLKFMSNWRGDPDSSIVVVMLTQAKIKSCSGWWIYLMVFGCLILSVLILFFLLGRWLVSISNLWNGSKLLMGDECAELVRFKEQWIKYVIVKFFIFATLFIINCMEMTLILLL